MSRPGTTRGSSYPFLQRGLPFFAFMIGGSYGISILLQVRTDSHIPPHLFLLPFFGHRRVLGTPPAAPSTDAPHDDREGTR